MAGDYCEKTFAVDYAVRPVGTPLCNSGQGKCGGWFGVEAPGLVAGQNAYVLLVPNCRCGR